MNALFDLDTDLEEIVEAFELAWVENKQTSIQDFLPPNEHIDFATIITELVRCDMEQNWERGCRVTVARYKDELFDRLNWEPNEAELNALVFEEYRLSHRFAATRPKSWFAEFYSVDASGWPDWPNEKNEAEPCKQELKFERFELIGEIGHGVSSKVFLAKQADLASRLVVLKVSNEVSVEPELLAKLQHTNIVPIYSYHEGISTALTTHQNAICMPFFGVITLKDLIETNRRAPDKLSSQSSVETALQQKLSTYDGKTRHSLKAIESRERERLPKILNLDRSSYALEIMIQITDAVTHAHQRGITHSDLKPANILITDEGTPMVLDFHLSTQIGGRFELFGGTIPYMAPEHIVSMKTKEKPNFSTDIYACGVILYELLTGKVPFDHSNGDLNEKEVQRIVEKRKEPISYKEIDSPSLRSIISKCIAVEPTNRYQTAEELHFDLLSHQQNRPLQYATNRSLSERITKWKRRHPILAITGTSFAISVMLVGILLMAFLSRGKKIAILESENQARRLTTRLENASSSLFTSQLDGKTIESQEALLNELLDEAHSFQNALDKSNFSVSTKVSPISELNEQVHLTMLIAGNNDESELPQDSVAKKLADAFLNYQAGNLNNSELLLKNVIAEASNNYNAWLVLGNIHARQQKYIDASACYEICQSLKPNVAWAYLQHGFSSFDLGDSDKAIKKFSKAIEINPFEPTAYANRGICYRKTGLIDKALADFDKALQLGAQQTRLYFLRSKCKQELGDVEGARKDFEQGMSNEPNDEISFVTRAVKIAVKDPENAIADLHAALRINPKSSIAHQNLSAVYASVLRDNKKAIEHLNEILKMSPNDPTTLASKGVILARMGERENAHLVGRLALQQQTNFDIQFRVAGIFALTVGLNAETDAEDTETSLKLLRLAARENPKYVFNMMNSDSDLDLIRKNSGFKKLHGEIASLLK